MGWFAAEAVPSCEQQNGTVFPHETGQYLGAATIPKKYIFKHHEPEILQAVFERQKKMIDEGAAQARAGGGGEPAAGYQN